MYTFCPVAYLWAAIHNLSHPSLLMQLFPVPSPTFPHPGGPQKIKDGRSPDSKTVYSIESFPRTECCPTYSCIFEGLAASANGMPRESFVPSLDDPTLL